MNRLANEKSPYLLQHAHNPVDWYPWGEEAFEKAARENKPIFLSVGYSTCHWCHVMEHESFENDEIARILNRVFRAGESGSRGAAGRGSRVHAVRAGVDGQRRMADVGVADAGAEAVFRRNVFSAGQSLWAARIPGDSGESGAGVAGRSGAGGGIRRAGDRAVEGVRGARCRERARRGREALDSAFYGFRRMFDSRLGGFGGAPKFPRPSVHNFLLRYYAATKNEEALEMVLLTLREMAKGGMNDQLGGGFHRYSVDERWFVPHFEKMLYDQAQTRGVVSGGVSDYARRAVCGGGARYFFVCAARSDASGRRIFFGGGCR